MTESELELWQLKEALRVANEISENCQIMAADVSKTCDRQQVEMIRMQRELNEWRNRGEL